MVHLFAGYVLFHRSYIGPREITKQTPSVRFLTAALILVSVTAGTTSFAAGLKTGKICFYRNDWIFLKDLATGQESKLVAGFSPQLAPAGDSIAYLAAIEQKPEPQAIEALLLWSPGGLRVLSLRIMKSRSFESLRESRVSTALWSSTGKLAFVRENKGRRSIAMLNPLTGNIDASITADWDTVIGRTDGIYLDSWTPVDRSVLFHTLSALYEAEFETGNIRKLAVEGVFGRGEISSASTFLFSPDRKYLVFDHISDTAEDPERELISLYDNRWLSSICKIGLDGRGLATLVTNADYPSYALR